MAGNEMFSMEFSPDMRKFVISFDKWAKEVKDWRPAWTDIRDMFRNHERKHLDSEGLSTGAKFDDLNDRYAKEKDKSGYSGLPILQRDRVLYRALVEGGSGSLFRRNRKSMEIGIKKGYVTPGKKGKPGRPLYIYAEAHQTGTTLEFGGILPARPPVRFGKDVTNKDHFAYGLSQIMQAHIVLARRRAFKKEIEASFGKAHAESEGAARATISKMKTKDWR
tara:strand:+ start:439 stop:1101 length:663 start_codon:yes stop_codon:yes gene_type:complete